MNFQDETWLKSNLDVDIIQITLSLVKLMVYPWLIHVNVWQKPLQYCKVISLQLIKMGKKPKTDGLGKEKKSLQGKNHRFLHMKWHYVRSLLEILLKSERWNEIGKTLVTTEAGWWVQEGMLCYFLYIWVMFQNFHSKKYKKGIAKDPK